MCMVVGAMWYANIFLHVVLQYSHKFISTILHFLKGNRKEDTGCRGSVF